MMDLINNNIGRQILAAIINADFYRIFRVYLRNRSYFKHLKFTEYNNLDFFA